MSAHVPGVPDGIFTDTPVRRYRTLSPRTTSERNDVTTPPNPSAPPVAKELGWELGALHLETQAALMRAHEVESLKHQLQTELLSLRDKQSVILRQLAGQPVALTSASPGQGTSDPLIREETLLDTLEVKAEEYTLRCWRRFQEGPWKELTEGLLTESTEDKKQVGRCVAELERLRDEFTALKTEVEALKAGPKPPRHSVASETDLKQTTDLAQQTNSEGSPTKTGPQRIVDAGPRAKTSRIQLELPIDTRTEESDISKEVGGENPDDSAAHWKEIEDAEGNIVFYNTATKVAQRDCPKNYWEEVQTSTGTPFYYCKETKAKSWALPPGAALVKKDNSVDEDPANWERFVTDAGKSFFRNKVTRKKQWETPSCLAKNGRSSPPSKTPQYKRAFRGTDWIEFEHEGSPFYLNKVTKEKVWDRPKELEDVG